MWGVYYGTFVVTHRKLVEAERKKKEKLVVTK